MPSNPTQKLFALPDRRAAERELAVQPNSLQPVPAVPTLEAFGEWQRAFTYFNERLFGNSLPNCLITLTRRKNTLGYFCAEAFVKRDGSIAHEVSMNPSWLEFCGDAFSYSVLVHELCHLWRHVHGPANRKGSRGARGFHEVVWADKMQSIGLMPSDTGKPGGKRVGYAVQHYVIEGGPFDLACREFLIGGQSITWRDGFRPVGGGGGGGSTGGGAVQEGPAPKNTRTRYVCRVCGLKAWARASANFSHRDCNDAPMLAR